AAALDFNVAKGEADKAAALVTAAQAEKVSAEAVKDRLEVTEKLAAAEANAKSGFFGGSTLNASASAANIASAKIAAEAASRDANVAKADAAAAQAKADVNAKDADIAKFQSDFAKAAPGSAEQTQAQAKLLNAQDEKKAAEKKAVIEEAKSEVAKAEKQAKSGFFAGTAAKEDAKKAVQAAAKKKAQSKSGFFAGTTAEAN
ncbi:MAG: hypothetical protein CL779_02445, partial [Chloroflexi bacterium]|nr:hypothetical protein [Chloroflexota bacterium]